MIRRNSQGNLLKKEIVGENKIAFSLSSGKRLLILDISIVTQHKKTAHRNRTETKTVIRLSEICRLRHFNSGLEAVRNVRKIRSVAENRQKRPSDREISRKFIRKISGNR